MLEINQGEERAKEGKEEKRGGERDGMAEVARLAMTMKRKTY